MDSFWEDKNVVDVSGNGDCFLLSFLVGIVNGLFPESTDKLAGMIKTKKDNEFQLTQEAETELRQDKSDANCSVDDLRTAVVDYIKTHRVNYEGFLENHDMKKYISKMKKKGEYVENVFISALANMTGVTIEIVEAGQPHPSMKTISPELNSKKNTDFIERVGWGQIDKVQVLYESYSTNSGHYKAIVPSSKALGKTAVGNAISNAPGKSPSKSAGKAPSKRLPCDLMTVLSGILQAPSKRKALGTAPGKALLKTAAGKAPSKPLPYDPRKVLRGILKLTQPNSARTSCKDPDEAFGRPSSNTSDAAANGDGADDPIVIDDSDDDSKF